MTSPVTVTALLPCPFCGGEATPDYSAIIGEDQYLFHCQSADCPAWPNVSGPTEAEAIAAWNTRLATEAASAERVGGLLEALEPFIRDWHDAGVPDNIDGKRAMIAVDDGHGMTVGDWRALVAAYNDLRAALRLAAGEG